MSTVKVKDLRELREIAEKRLINGDALGALKIFRLLLQAAPLDFRTRLRIADCLLVLGDARLAVSVYLAVAVFCSKAGLPLRALVAVKMIAHSYPQVKSLMRDIAVLYGKDSPVIGRGARAAPVDLSARVREDLDLDYNIDEEELKDSAARMAAQVDDITKYPNKLPPIRPLSDLSADALGLVIDVLELRRLDGGEVVVRKGERRDAMFIVARGLLTSTSSLEKPDRPDRPDRPDEARRMGLTRETRKGLSSLGEGSVFGEVSLVSGGPWGATVFVEQSADLLVLSRERFADVVGEFPEVAEVLLAFAKKRMIRSIMKSCVLFAPFDEQERFALFKRFEMHTVKAGTVFIRGGEEARGLYIILAGAAEVHASGRSGDEQALATLGPEDCFGEISLVYGCSTTAKVKAVEETTVLFLAKEYFERLTETYPTLANYYASLGKKRLLEIRKALGA